MNSPSKWLPLVGTMTIAGCGTTQQSPNTAITPPTVAVNQEKQHPEPSQDETKLEREEQIVDLMKKYTSENLQICLINKKLEPGQCQSASKDAEACEAKGFQRLAIEQGEISQACKTAATFFGKPIQTEDEEHISARNSMECGFEIGVEKLEEMRNTCNKSAHRCLAEKIVNEEIPCEPKDFYMRLLMDVYGK